MVATVFSCFSSAIDQHPLLPRLETADDLHASLWHPVVRGEKLDQGVVRLAVHSFFPNSDLEPLAMPARELGARRAGLDVEVEDQTVAAAMRGARWFTTISTTY